MQCKKAIWKSSRQLGELLKGRGNKKNVPKCSNWKQFSIQPYSADCQHRDEEPLPLVASLPVENADSGHMIYSPAALGLSGFRLVPLLPTDILYALSLLSFCHRPLAPEIPSSDKEHLSLGYRPSSFQCLITLGNISFECTASEFSVESEFATAYLHCHNEDISSKINIPE